MTVKEFDIKNRIDIEEFENISKILYSTVSLNSATMDITNLDKRKELLIYYSEFLNKLLIANFDYSSKIKLELIDFIDKLNHQRELLELITRETKIEDVKKAGKHLAKKSQSAFKNK
jgi:hypothetical protein